VGHADISRPLVVPIMWADPGRSDRTLAGIGLSGATRTPLARDIGLNRPSSADDGRVTAEPDEGAVVTHAQPDSKFTGGAGLRRFHSGVWELLPVCRCDTGCALAPSDSARIAVEAYSELGTAARQIGGGAS
jgi:hypothetical protein